MADVMIDIETMGTAADCVVLTLGAVKFDPLDPSAPTEDLYIRLDIEQQILMDRSVDQGTMDWWDKQSKEVREEAFSAYDRITVEQSLLDLQQFLEGTECAWAQGPQFDMVILEDLFRKANMKTPWRYSKVRDTRTLFAVLGDQRPTDKPSAHNALSDCHYQVKGVQSCFQSLLDK